VIGAGFGRAGLAIRLQSAGVRTTLFEARDKPAAAPTSTKTRASPSDAGPTVITDPSSLEELWALSGRKLADYVELLPVSPFYRLEWSDGFSFDYVNDQAELDRQIAAVSPRDVDGLPPLPGLFR
jgi:phytoene desaturase